MKLKNKIAVALVTVLLVSIGTVSALVYHIEDASKALKSEYAERIEEYKSTKDFKIKNDVSHLTQEQIERLRTETADYLQLRLNQDYSESLNEKTEEIIRVTDEKIEEIKQYIDELLNAE